MAGLPFAGLFKRRSRRRGGGLARVGDLDLDLVMPPPYDMSQVGQQQAREEVRQLVAGLRPGGLDSGSREVLNNLVNARCDQALAEVDAARDERQAVADALVGLAAEQVARCKPRYDADLARVAQSATALAVTFEELTGRKATEYVPPRPKRAEDGAIESSLGPIDISDDETFADGGGELRDGGD